MKVTVSFSKEKLENAHKLSCLHDKCDTSVRLDTLKALMPIEFSHKYVQFYTDLQILQARDSFVYCKNKKCNKLIVAKFPTEIDSEWTQGHSSISVCECGEMICNYCLQEMHFPAFCRQAKDYFKNMAQLAAVRIEDPSELATSEGKQCPNCNNYMEKNMGCNHMSCPCGFQFCWLCLKDFYGSHQASNGYFCKNKEVQTTVYDSSHFVNFKNLSLKYSTIMRDTRMRKNSTQYQHKLDTSLNNLSQFSMGRLAKKIRLVLESHESNKTELIKDLLATHGLKERCVNQKNFSHALSLIRYELADSIERMKSNFVQFDSIIEYLALLLSRRSKKFRIGDYSFGTNLHMSLKRAVLIHAIYSEIIHQEEKSLSHLRRIVYYDKIIGQFVSNLEHLIVDFLQIYV